MSKDCLFCKIIGGEIPSDKVFENERVLAFRDISPVAPQHILVIPKQHKASLSEFEASDKEILGELMLTAAQLAKDLGIAESGYRTVVNTGAEAGQTVFHLHVHLIGGRKLEWAN